MKNIFRLISLMMVFFISTGLRGEESSDKNSLVEIGKQIEMFRNLKKKHEKNRVRHINLAHRWQGNTEFSLESKREYTLAENLLDKIRLLDKKIQKLEKEREEKERDLLQEIR